MTESQNPPDPKSPDIAIQQSDCPEGSPVDLTKTQTPGQVESVDAGNRESVSSISSFDDPLPTQIGKFVIERQLGAGGFGRVYLARDPELRRFVAVKVPHAFRVATPEAVEEFLEEARILAKLEHPGIVVVYDFGRYENRCYIVTRYIDGETLRQRQRREPLSESEAVEILTTLAETLSFIHTQGVVHRDIKPGNVLLDREGNCYLADFGLALKDNSVGIGPGVVGTVGYMSPEQVRGEGHLVDGRSDLFSLGVVMYELLTGFQPFDGPDAGTVMQMIAYRDPSPLRQRRPKLPRELERICLKLLSKSASDRYSTAQDLIEDLRCCSREVSTSTLSEVSVQRAAPLSEDSSQSHHIGIVPRGLRSFDQEDAEFFRDLLPGPQDRNGVPDSLRFWCRRIDSNDPSEVFRLGVIYGPSGSGKSSFVKAGLLPLLKSGVLPIFLEASGDDTERRLLQLLRQKIPGLPQSMGLSATLTLLRRSGRQLTQKKILIILDQFEQWLHVHGESPEEELITALRQCDGIQLQSILLIRDDFWLAISRLAERVDVELVRRHNLGMVDLFDRDHGKRVLIEYGRAYGRLPEKDSEITREQQAFVDQAIEGLSESGKLIPVRLVTFAEIMKSRTWDPRSLRELGGIQGVGSWFLEESFGRSSAPAQYREHLAAVQSLLKSLLPEAGTDIKGAMRSASELLKSAGYVGEPRKFSELMSILDSDLKLITPAERRGSELSGQNPAERFYQLTHDFLVPAVREWLERYQQQTVSGRAALRLTARTEIWQSRPETRLLPNWLEWLNYLLFTRASRRSPLEQRMMRAATRYHGRNTLIVSAILALCLWMGVATATKGRAQSLVRQLTTASLVEVPQILNELDGFDDRILSSIESMSKPAPIDTPAGLNVRLARLRHHPENDILQQELLEYSWSCRIEQLPLIAEELSKLSNRQELEGRLWSVLESARESTDRRFSSALVLSSWIPGSDQQRTRWKEVAGFVSAQMVAHCSHPGHYAAILQMLRPAQDVVLPGLLTRVREREHSPQRELATLLVLDLLANSPERLAEIYLDVDEVQAVHFYPILDRAGSSIDPILERASLTDPVAEESPDEQRAKSVRQVNAVVELLRRGKVVDLEKLLSHRPNPSTRAGLIERIAAIRPSAAKRIQSLFQSARDPGVRSGAALILGSMPLDQLDSGLRQSCVETAQNFFRKDPSPDVHAATEWLLKQWDHQSWIDKEIAELSSENRSEGCGWRVNSQGQELVVMKLSDHSAEMGAQEVSVEQFLKFRPGYFYEKAKAPDVRCPAIMITWYDAVEYCRWLTVKEGMGEEDQCFSAPGTTEVVHLKPDYLSRRGYRLPSAHEWEFAYHSGTTTEYPFGHDLNLVDRYGAVTSDLTRLSQDYTLTACGLSKPDPFGFFDLIGNVGEWCADLDYTEPASPHPFVRGSTANTIPTLQSKTQSGSFPAETRFYSMGFRIARSLKIETH